jgi:hypothetical protein
MSNEQNLPTQLPFDSAAGGVPAGDGVNWGDPVDAARQAALRALAIQQQVWAAQPVSERGTSPMAGVPLSAADVFWLVAYALAGPDGDIATAETILRDALHDDRLALSLNLSPLIIEGATILGLFPLYFLPPLGARQSDAARGAPADGPAPSAWSHPLDEDEDDEFDEDDGNVRGASGPETPAGGEQTVVPPAPPDAQPSATPSQPLERVAFTSAYPREVNRKVWERLLVFISLDTAEAAAQVEAMTAERLLRSEDYRSASAPSPATLRRGARLTIAPCLPGFRVDPATLTAEWTEDAQCYEFRVRAEEAQAGLAVNGVVQVFEGPLLRGEVPLAIYVRAERKPALKAEDRTATARSAGYRNTFPSYSRLDESIVRAFENVVEASGDRFLRDVRTLRAGEEWAPALLTLIDRADVFQLFWSTHAAASHQVAREWRYALERLSTRPTFIRPVYWTSRPAPVPRELEQLNFARLDPTALGLPRPSGLASFFRRG